MGRAAWPCCCSYEEVSRNLVEALLVAGDDGPWDRAFLRRHEIHDVRIESEFLRELAKQESAAGCLRLGIAYIDGQPAAAQFWTVENGIALIHKLSHDERFISASPGTLLSAALFQHVIDIDRVQEIDFGTGSDAYKREWMEEMRPRYRLEMFWPNHMLNWPHIIRHKLRK